MKRFFTQYANLLRVINLFFLFLLAGIAIFMWHRLQLAAVNSSGDYSFFYTIFHGHPAGDFWQAIRVVGPVSGIAANLNTPTMSLFIYMLMNASHFIAVNTAIWVITCVSCAAWSVFILIRWIDSSSTSMLFFPCCLIFLLSWPNLENLLGEVALFLLPLVCIAFWFMASRKLTCFAVSLGVLASLKLFFLIFALFFILKKQWQMLFLFLASFLFFFWIPILFFTWHYYIGFFRLMSDQMLMLQHAFIPTNPSFLGLTADLSFVLQFFKIGLTLKQIYFISTAISLYCIIRWCVYDYRVLSLLPVFRDEIRFGCLVILALLCSPLGWIYYFAFLLIPAAIVYKISRSYPMPPSFYIFFVSGLLLPEIAWGFWSMIPGVESTLFLVCHFSVRLLLLTDLLCWFACLHYSARQIELSENSWIHTDEARTIGAQRC